MGKSKKEWFESENENQENWKIKNVLIARNGIDSILSPIKSKLQKTVGVMIAMTE